MRNTPLNARQVDLLQELFRINRRRPWVAPQDIGGTAGSHHTKTLASLAMRGLVQFKPRGAPSPPDGKNVVPGVRYAPLSYRITSAGEAAIPKRTSP